MRSNIFDRLSFLSLFLVIVLMPFFFLPFTNIPIETSKGTLLVVGLALSVVFWGFARFFDGKMSFPKSPVLLGAGGIVLVTLISALFVKSSEVSFFGTMFDIGTFWFIFAGFLFMLMCSIVFRDANRARVVLFGAILSSALLLFFQLIHLFKPGFSLGVLSPTLKIDNLLGSWNEVGLFAGFACLMSLLVVEFFSTTKMEKWILRLLIILSMFLIAAVNFPLVWGLLGVSALIIFVYKLSISSEKKSAGENESVEALEGEKTRRFPLLSFTIIMISLLFFMSGDKFIAGELPSRLQLSNPQIVFPFPLTAGIAQSVLKDNLIFGMGPNKFLEAWAMYKPDSVNRTIDGNDFWDIPFISGSGLLPTLVSTIGYAGILAWLAFFILFIIGGVKSIFSSIKNGINWETMAFFVLSLYLFVSSFFFSTGAAIFFLALGFAGIFAGLSASNSPKGEISWSFLNDHRKSFFSMLFIVLMIIISSAVSFVYIERLAAFSYYRQAVASAAKVETIPDALVSINRALSLYQNDSYWRAYSQIYMLKLNSLAQKADSLSEAEKTDFKSSFDQAVIGAERAVASNPKNYLNLQVLGSLYQDLASFGVEGANGEAVKAYTAASLLNPKNPGLKLRMAVASFADKKNQEAKDYIKASLTLKPDYIDAWIVLSQIARSEGENEDALYYAQVALSIFPTNADLIKYVDSLKKGIPASAPSLAPSPAPAPKKP